MARGESGVEGPTRVSRTPVIGWVLSAQAVVPVPPNQPNWPMGA
ncbi:hypothetical protein ACGFYZ_26805 [Streptomyces sp. NPDC048330]